MNNTMLAEALPSFDDDHYASEPVQSNQRFSSAASNRKNANRRNGGSGNDWSVITVLLICMFAICSIGVVYVAAFARVMWQSQNIHAIDAELTIAAARHEALVKELAVLQSDHRIGPLAAKFTMTQDDSNRFIDALPHQVSGRREVASAL